MCPDQGDGVRVPSAVKVKPGMNANKWSVYLHVQPYLVYSISICISILTGTKEFHEKFFYTAHSFWRTNVTYCYICHLTMGGNLMESVDVFRTIVGSSTRSTIMYGTIIISCARYSTVNLMADNSLIAKPDTSTIEHLLGAFILLKSSLIRLELVKIIWENGSSST